MRRPYHHGALRQALLASAAAILERDGIQALTLRAAARAAGVTHGSPAHHFGDLTGLLSALAASGFVGLRDTMQTEAEAAGADPRARMRGLGRGYVRFARSRPALFLLMFRSERLDWSNPALAAAGADAFAVLMQDRVEPAPSGRERLVAAVTRWSLAHGLSMLVIDGRLDLMAVDHDDAELETLVEGVLTGGLADR